MSSSPALGCLKLARFLLLRLQDAVRFLLGESLVEGVAAVFVDVVQPARERGVANRRIVLVAAHLGGIGLPVAKRRVGVGGGIVPGQIFG